MMVLLLTGRQWLSPLLNKNDYMKDSHASSAQKPACSAPGYGIDQSPHADCPFLWYKLPVDG